MTSRTDLTKYLLNPLTGPESDELLQRILSEDGFAEALEETERELLDAYVRKELPPVVRQDVERMLLSGPQQQVKLLVAQTLARRRPSKLARRVLPIAATVLIVVSAAMYPVFSHRHVPLPETASEPPPRPVPSHAAPLVTALLLSPGLTRGSRLPSVDLAAGISTLRLDLELPAGFSPPSVAVRLLDASGTNVWTASAAKPSPDGLSIEIPAGRLKPGRYRLLAGSRPAVGYYFEVK